jgi:DNA polymerase-1
VLYGSVNPNGAVTGRMTHSKPNIAQTPKPSTSSYGEECRALFGPRRGMVQVGCDAEGLEARNLGHYMARWDGGAYGRAIVEGNKDEGTDVHTVNQRALGLRKRDSAKTWLYAFMYGAGDYKLGTIVIEDMEPEERRKYKTKNAIVALGKRTRQMIAKNIPALAKLVDAVKKRVRDNGKLTGLDGRPLYSRSEHSALNLLLQSAGAVIMKKALVMFHTEAQARGHVVDVDFGYLLNVHDEVQIEAKPEIADELGTLMADCIHKAGEYFHFRCPLAGAWEKGNSWLETH